jgi:hypothetical protein
MREKEALDPLTSPSDTHRTRSFCVWGGKDFAERVMADGLLQIILL